MMMIMIIMIKFWYNACCRWLKERVLSDYKTRSWGKAVTPSANLYNVRLIPKFLSSFFFLFIKSKLFEQAGRQVATEEPNKSL